MNKCKDCKHFKPERYDPRFGGCDASAYWDEESPKSTDKLYAWDTESYFAAVRVGGDFGCANWESK